MAFLILSIETEIKDLVIIIVLQASYCLIKFKRFSFILDKVEEFLDEKGLNRNLMGLIELII